MATKEDADAVRRVHWSAFPEDERDLVSGLAVELLTGETFPPTFSLVSEVGDAVVGHVAFSPVTARGTRRPIGYILAPLAVRPDYQKRGIASRMVENGIERLSALGAGVLLVYGDPGFYRRFGFGLDQAKHYPPPCPLRHPHGWQALTLGNGEAPPSAVGISCVPCLNDPALW